MAEGGDPFRALLDSISRGQRQKRVNPRRMNQVLNALLDSLGLDEDRRQKRMMRQKMKQVLWSWNFESVSNRGIFLLAGSTYETTTIDGLSSDVDYVCIRKSHETYVIEDIKDWRNDLPYFCPAYKMDSSECYKSFVRLYLLSYERPDFYYNKKLKSPECHEVDASGRIIRTNDSTANIMKIPPSIEIELHGPAVTRSEGEGSQETDFVPALKCVSFPRDAAGWKTRQTPLTRTRISSAIIDEINHCYLVPIGNKASNTPHLEWRLSFSHIETALIHNWNNTQYKCYVMMKFIQKDIIKPQVPGALCSYHYKTIMMWMNEENPSEFFQETKFQQCILSVLDRLADAVRKKTLPHYFVDGCNLFYPKITNDQLLAKKLTVTIRGIIAGWPDCLCNITRCDLGNMIEKCLLKPAALTSICTSVHQERKKGYFYEIIQENDSIIGILRGTLHAIDVSDKSVNKKVLLLSELLKRSSQQQCDNDSKQFIDTAIKDALCSLGLELIQQGRSMNNKNALKRLRLGNRLLQLYLNSCCMDTSLKVATEFIITRKFQSALMLLDRVENQIKPYTQFRCLHGDCSTHAKSCLTEAVYDNKPSLVEYYKNYTVQPVTYKKSQMSHVPKGLVYEMFRITNVQQVKEPQFEDWRSSQAVIHCPVYLYYLRFLYHHRRGQDDRRQVALDNMTRAAKEISKSPGTHEETNHNIIGYCHGIVGDKQRAYKEYRKSFKKEEYNAVLWHLAVLLRKNIRSDQ